MKELVQYLARYLVNNPDAVEVKETQGDTASVLELKVAREDLGRIIGKQGRTAKSIRTILNAAASRHQSQGGLGDRRGQVGETTALTLCRTYYPMQHEGRVTHIVAGRLVALGEIVGTHGVRGFFASIPTIRPLVPRQPAGQST
jgi:predicted RNA-binding protein YlqC (UPF0109 family)